MTQCEDVFQFLDLPAELRNRVYDLATTKPDNDKCCVLPCLSLAQANRQLRAEYLPTCMKARVTIAWTDLPNYLATFYPIVQGQLHNVEQAPSAITVIADLDHKNQETIMIDLLPLTKMRHADAGFSCQFVHASPTDFGLEEDEPEGRYMWLKADNDILLKLIYHTHAQWLHDVTTGRIEKILIDFVGTADEPTASFYVYADEVAGSSVEACGIEADDDGHHYLEPVQLSEIWTTKVAGISFDMHTSLFWVKG